MGFVDLVWILLDFGIFTGFDLNLKWWVQTLKKNLIVFFIFIFSSSLGSYDFYFCGASFLSYEIFLRFSMYCESLVLLCLLFF